MVDLTNGLKQGDADLSNFMGRHRRAGVRQASRGDRPRPRDERHRGRRWRAYDDSVGYHPPTILEIGDARGRVLPHRVPGPILSVHVYEDGGYDGVLDQMERFSPYGLTGSIIAQDRRAIAEATDRLRFAAGNFYINDKPTGASAAGLRRGAPPGRTTRPARPRTCFAGPASARSRRRSSRRRATPACR